MRKFIMNDMLSFVITEDCNFLCDHCMRECRRPNTISEEVIDAVLSQIKLDKFASICICGGEGMLQIKKIIYLINRTYELGNRPRFVEITTNGSIAPSKFEELAICLAKWNVPLKMTISDDPYHKAERDRLFPFGLDIYKVVEEYNQIMFKYNYFNSGSEFPPIMVQKFSGYGSSNYLKAIGRAVNIEGAVFEEINFDIHEYVKLRGRYINGSLQVMTDGRLVPGIDMSWPQADANYGPEYNILCNSVGKILRR